MDSLAVPKPVGGAELHLVRINARFQTEVFDEFSGTVHARTREGITVLDDIREALAMVYEEADSHGVFDVGELRRVYGEDYERSRSTRADSHGVFDVGELRRVYGEDYERLAIDEMGRRWTVAVHDLDVAINDRDLDAVESHLSELRRLNRTFSRLSTERYLRTLATDDLHARR